VRIALITPGGVDRSGEYRVIPALLALIERVAAQHELRVFALTQESEPGTWRLAGADVHNIGTHHTRLRALRTLLRVYESAAPEVIHAVWSGACGQIAIAAGILMRRPTLIHVAGAELAAVPEIGYGARLSWKGRLLEPLVLRRATAVSAASQPIVDKIAELGVTASRIPLGVDARRWPPREPVRRRSDRPARLIHVASLNAVKDQTTLLHAAAALAQSGIAFELDVVGEDTLGGAIQHLAEELQLTSRVRFHGFLTQSQLRPLVEGADLMLISSRHETGPVVLLEAAMAGVPTVGTAVGHIAEWAPEAAVAVPVGHAHALALAAKNLLLDEELRLRVAAAAYARARSDDADNTSRLFEGLYAVLKSKIK
jgi:glycosyltransferase involved in cell wall biosynthesis